MNPFKSDNSGYQRNNKYESDSRFFKNKKQSVESKPTKKEKEFTVEQNEFPILAVQTEPSDSLTTSMLKSSMSFVDMMKESMNADNNTSILEEVVDPGWVSIKRNKETSQIEWKWGSKTEYGQRLDRKEQLQDDLNYSMHKAISKIHGQQIRYEELYDEIYGEGAYNHIYRYGTQDDSTTDDETDNDDHPYDYHVDEDDYY